MSNVHLPTDAKARKALPIITGVLDYFPDAIAEVAELSRIGNDQHNPGQPLQWSKHKSSDHADCVGRHMIDRGTRDTDNVRHSTKVAWRALAMLQIEIEADRANMPVNDYLAKLKADADAAARECPEDPSCGAAKGEAAGCKWGSDCQRWRDAHSRNTSAV